MSLRSRSTYEPCGSKRVTRGCCAPRGMGLQGFLHCRATTLRLCLWVRSGLGKRVGSKLIEFARSMLDHLTVDVNEENTAALGFYRARGFSITARSNIDDQ